ncbi:hypothetical protein [Cognataquiflexum aquatile]|uniref:hypothetical protein n=1 Tax=Cognataquiflexum aquatile TaxID=2249427 RepID=UPI000DE9621C|nr:hypothetical protein [Cognataquiflexum aquatile]
MKISKSNPTGLIVSSVLMVIGAGAIIGFFTKKSNQKKASQASKFFMKKLKEEGKSLKNKAKDRLESSRKVLDNVSNV